MAAPDTLHCFVSPGETRLALTAAGTAVELAVIRAAQSAGGVWLGRVIKAGGHGAFVDIGADRAGWLARTTASEGAAVLVQAIADAHADKGAVLTADVSLTGRLLALSPMRPGVAVSRRLDAAERQRLLEVVQPLAAAGEGIVVRTGAGGAAIAALTAELEGLRARWRAVEAAARDAKPPALLLPPDPLARLLADTPTIDRLVVDDAEAFAALRRAYPGVTVTRGADFDVDEALEQALSPSVPLPSGGKLTIELTAAAVMVDVDAGGGAIDAANTEAVAVLAWHLRLRNLSGHILVDLIPTKAKDKRARLVEALRRAVADDPTPTHVVGTTPLGMLELTRERRRPSLAEVVMARRLEPSTETLALAALRAVLREAAGPGWPHLAVAPEVAAALAHLPQAVAETERRLARPLRIAAVLELARERFDIRMER